MFVCLPQQKKILHGVQYRVYRLFQSNNLYVNIFSCAVFKARGNEAYSGYLHSAVFFLSLPADDSATK